MFFLLIPPPPLSTLFPYTTLFRSVITAEAHAPDRDALRVEVVALLDPVAHRLGRTLIVAADGNLVLGFALPRAVRSEEHTSELQSRQYLVCRLLLEKKKKKTNTRITQKKKKRKIKKKIMTQSTK